MLSPLRDEFLLRFLFWEDIFILLTSLFVFLFFVRDVPWEAINTIWIFPHRVVHKISIIDVIKGGEEEREKGGWGPPATQETTSASHVIQSALRK